MVVRMVSRRPSASLVSYSSEGSSVGVKEGVAEFASTVGEAASGAVSVAGSSAPHAAAKDKVTTSRTLARDWRSLSAVRLA